ncbi:MAG TPA: histidine kinase [Nocardioidaceae bacterium]|nr:histidine kinase [Nocardioidaceae bacterium]
MTGRAAEQSYDIGVWAALSKRVSPYLDTLLGLGAAVLSVASLLSTDVATIDSRLEPSDPLSVAATFVAGLSLVWRRSRPVASFVVFVSCCLVVTLTDHYIGLLSILLLLSLYSLAAHGRRKDAVAGLGVCLLTFIGLALLDVPDLRTSDVLEAWALLLTAWALGDAIRSRRTQQSERLRTAEQEAATAREQAARAVVEERLRIARELHDVVAHSMSLIAVQAGVGAHVIRSDVGAAEQALEVIADTSRKALTQTRSMLGLLREEDTDVAAHPMHTIDDLDDLIADVSRAGLDVAFTVDGPARTLDAGIELTADRIVPASLTNVLKHSSARHAQVRVLYVEDGVDVEVSDNGSGGRPTTLPIKVAGGHGLVGLRERTRLLGGALEYGMVDGVGFKVSAHLPSSKESAS